MCLILIAHNLVPDRPLLVLANRDEFYARPTAPAAPWTEQPELVAGRDLQSGGTWLGVRGDGRWAAVTNVRQGLAHRHHPRSRGWLVRDYLLGEQPPEAFIDRLFGQRQEYGGFNLLVGDTRQLWHLSNRGETPPRLLPAGLYGLSNAGLDTPWPKLVRGRAGLAELLANRKPLPHAGFALLADRSLAADAELPATGVPHAWERALSAIFIATPDYGTRCSSVLSISAAGEIDLFERSFGPEAHPAGDVHLRLAAGRPQSVLDSQQ